MARKSWAGCLLIGMLSLVPTWVGAATPTAEIFPDTTQGYVSVAHAKQLAESWRETQLGKLWNDPAMKNFAEDLGDQLRQNYGGFLTDLGLTIEDLEEVAAAEVGLGMIAPAKGDPGVAVLADVSGNKEIVTQLLSKVDAKLKEQKAKKSTKQVGGTTITQYEIREPDPRDSDAPEIVTHAALWVHGDWFCAASTGALAEELLGRTIQPLPDHLQSVASYQAVMKRCQSGAGDLAPQARWFVRPLELANTLRVFSRRPKPEGTDMLKVLNHQGFTAIRGVGGLVNLALGEHDLLHRTFVYAPPPYDKAMRMLSFPNGGELLPGAWVPADVATYISVRWDMKNAFEKASTLFDELFGEGEEGVFEETLASIRDDPNGPGIDVRKDLIAHIGDRATIVIDYQLPITPTSEQMVFAAETNNEQALAAAIEKSMSGDPTVVKREVQGHTVWEIKEEEAPDAPTVELGDELGLETPASPVEEEEEEMSAEDEEGRLLGSSAITVAYGHIFVANQVSFLEKILAQAASGEPGLAATADYQRVHREMQRLGATQIALEMFRRTENEHRCSYELLREGKMPESQSLMGKMLNQAMAVKEGEVRKSQIDGSQLPEYDSIRHYFGPAGLFMTSEDEGWYATGFTLQREAPAAAADAGENVLR